VSSTFPAVKPVPIARGKADPTPKYYQLKETLRDQISAWEADHPIPSEPELCRMYAVSRTTVRKALEDLVHEGLLYRVQGVGTFVAPPKLRERFVQRTAGFYEDMVSRGLNVRTRIVEQSVVRASRQVAAELQLASGEKVIKFLRVRYIGNDPILISTSFVSQRLFPDLETEDLTKASLYALMREKYGVQLTHGTRLVEAAACTEDDAKYLRVKPRTPVLVVTGTVYDVEGRPVEYGFARHRSDRSQIEIEIATH
jgi:GntR family transcriptional regulator